jgi:hypothetical protein
MQAPIADGLGESAREIGRTLLALLFLLLTGRIYRDLTVPANIFLISRRLDLEIRDHGVDVVLSDFPRSVHSNCTL